MLGLRTCDGVDEAAFAAAHGAPWELHFREVAALGDGRGWLERAHGRLRLTPEGLLFSDAALPPPVLRRRGFREALFRPGGVARSLRSCGGHQPASSRAFGLPCQDDKMTLPKAGLQARAAPALKNARTGYAPRRLKHEHVGVTAALAAPEGAQPPWKRPRGVSPSVGRERALGLPSDPCLTGKEADEEVLEEELRRHLRALDPLVERLQPREAALDLLAGETPRVGRSFVSCPG